MSMKIKDKDNLLVENNLFIGVIGDVRVDETPKTIIDYRNIICWKSVY